MLNWIFIADTLGANSPNKSGTGINWTPYLSILLSILGIGGGVSVIQIIKSWRNKKVYVKEITKANDDDLHEFIDLYENIISENTRITAEEIIEWIPKKKLNKKKEVTHNLFLCKQGNKVIGFLKTMYCNDSNYMFIAYLGIDKEVANARKIASKYMVNKLESSLKKNFSKCQGIFFEVEAPNDKIEVAENQQRKAKIRLFKEAIKKRGHIAYEVDIKYTQPEIPNNYQSSTKDEELILLYVPLKIKYPQNLISKKHLIESLQFIYFKIYAPTHHKDKEMDELYKNYLASKLEEYKKNLPDKIKLK